MQNINMIHSVSQINGSRNHQYIIIKQTLFTFGRVRYVGVQWLAVLIVRVTAVVHAQRTQAQIMIYRQK